MENPAEALPRIRTPAAGDLERASTPQVREPLPAPVRPQTPRRTTPRALAALLTAGRQTPEFAYRDPRIPGPLGSSPAASSFCCSSPILRRPSAPPGTLVLPRDAGLWVTLGAALPVPRRLCPKASPLRAHDAGLSFSLGYSQPSGKVSRTSLRSLSDVPDHCSAFGPPWRTPNAVPSDLHFSYQTCWEASLFSRGQSSSAHRYG